MHNFYTFDYDHHFELAESITFVTFIYRYMYSLPDTERVAESEAVPTALVAWQRYVPVSPLVVVRTVRVPSVDDGLNVYLKVEDEIVI